MAAISKNEKKISKGKDEAIKTFSSDKSLSVMRDLTFSAFYTF